MTCRESKARLVSKTMNLSALKFLRNPQIRSRSDWRGIEQKTPVVCDGGKKIVF